MKMDPVSAWEGISARRLLTSIEDAALFLLHQGGPQYRGVKPGIRAQIAVLAALDGVRCGGRRQSRIRRRGRTGEGAGDSRWSDQASPLPGHIARPGARKRAPR